MLSLAELNKQFLNYSHQPFNAQNGLAVLLCNANEHFYLRSKHNSTQVPSTRIRIISKTEIFLRLQLPSTSNGVFGHKYKGFENVLQAVAF